MPFNITVDGPPSSPWDRYAEAAKTAGCPKDQFDTFVKAGYIATPPQLLFHSAARRADLPGLPYLLGLGGTRGSAKSHCGFGQMAIDDCQREPDLKCLILRQTQKAAGEQFQDLMYKVLKSVDCDKNTEKISYPNGSKIVIGGFKDEQEIDKYVGLEYDGILIFELGQIPGNRIVKLRGSLRTSKSKWRPRLYADFNSGGKGFGEVKKMFINPWRAGQETISKFFECWYKDNPFINMEYREYLEGLTGFLRKIWVENDWDVFAGQAFPELSPGVHGFREYPDGWAKWPDVASLDWGYEKPYAFYLAKMDHEGRFWVYYEFYGYGGAPNVGTQESVDVVATRYKGDIDKLNVKPIIHLAGPDFFAKGAGSGIIATPKKYSEFFHDHGIYLTEMPTPPNSRIPGKILFHQRLHAQPGKKPGLMIHPDNCPHAWRTLPELVYDENGSGDISNDPNRDEDHCCDALRHLSRWREWGVPKVRRPEDLPGADIISKLEQTYNQGISKLDKSHKPKNRRLY